MWAERAQPYRSKNFEEATIPWVEYQAESGWDSPPLVSYATNLIHTGPWVIRSSATTMRIATWRIAVQAIPVAGGWSTQRWSSMVEHGHVTLQHHHAPTDACREGNISMTATRRGGHQSTGDSSLHREFFFQNIVVSYSFSFCNLLYGRVAL